MYFTAGSWTFRLSAVLCVLHIANAAEWSYTNMKTGPNHWADHFQTCGPIRQSPINFRNSETTFDPTLRKIKIIGNSSAINSDVKYTVINNGHSAMIRFPADMWFVSVTDGGEPHYSVIQLHFHWGSNNSRGAEHSLNGKVYPLEMHMVTYNKLLYPNSSLATYAAEGLAAFGFWAELSSSADKDDTLFAALGKFEKSLTDIISPEAEKRIDAFDLSDLLDHVDPSAYYRYSGSLSTPPCTPNVIWTVFNKPAAVTAKQLGKLRSLEFPITEGQMMMQNNYRPVQPLNNENSFLRRNVFVSWNHAQRTTTSLLLVSMLGLCKLS